MDNATTDMNRRLNNLLAEFSLCDSGPLSTLDLLYEYNGCQAWIYNDKCLDTFYTTWRKASLENTV